MVDWSLEINQCARKLAVHLSDKNILKLNDLFGNPLQEFERSFHKAKLEVHQNRLILAYLIL